MAECSKTDQRSEKCDFQEKIESSPLIWRGEDFEDKMVFKGIEGKRKDKGLWA